MAENSIKEIDQFKPIPVQSSSALSLKLRCLVDFQLATIVSAIRPKLSAMHGSVLDIGCGEMPFRGFLPPDAYYTGIDVSYADGFGMSANTRIVYFDGINIPFPDNTFDNAICTEVLEHAENHIALISEIHRVMKPGATAVITIPFSARLHHLPYDYHRFTKMQLQRLFNKFSEVEITPRGNDITVIANKIIVINMRLAKLKWLLLFVFMIPVSGIFILIANLSLLFHFGSDLDPLGYTVTVRK